MNEHLGSKAQAWLMGHVLGGYHTILMGTCSLRPQGRRASLGLQVLLTGKPCRNFQVLLAYSMLQMVRQQVLQERMTGDDILLVRAASCKAQPSPTGPRRPLTLLPLGNSGETDILRTLCQALV